MYLYYVAIPTCHVFMMKRIYIMLDIGNILFYIIFQIVATIRNNYIDRLMMFAPIQSVYYL